MPFLLSEQRETEREREKKREREEEVLVVEWCEKESWDLLAYSSFS